MRTQVGFLCPALSVVAVLAHSIGIVGLSLMAAFWDVFAVFLNLFGFGIHFVEIFIRSFLFWLPLAGRHKEGLGLFVFFNVWVGREGFKGGEQNFIIYHRVVCHWVILKLELFLGYLLGQHLFNNLELRFCFVKNSPRFSSSEGLVEEGLFVKKIVRVEVLEEFNLRVGFQMLVKQNRLMVSFGE